MLLFIVATFSCVILVVTRIHNQPYFMSLRTQSAKQDVAKAEYRAEIETLIRETAATEHVSFAC